MSEEFDEIQDILAGILGDKPKAPAAAPPPKAAARVATPEPDEDFLNLDEFTPAPVVITTTIDKSGERKHALTSGVLPKGMALPGSDEDVMSIFDNRDDDYGSDPTEDARIEASLPKGDVTVAIDTSGSVSDEMSKMFADSVEQSHIKVPVPTFTSADMMQSFDIRNFATLVTLQTNRWHAKVKDRQASKDAAKANSADERAFETRKKLLVGADSMLVAIHKAIDAARIEHYAMTLPWSTTGLDDTGRRTGGRLLMNTLFFEYTQKMAKYRKEMEDALNAFEPEYPNLIAIAKTKLGKRFDPREYPNPSAIRTHFNLSFDFQPIPKGEDFMGLPKQQLDKLAQHLNNQTQTMLENAMQENWVRMREVIAAMVERLSSPDKRFHSTLVENVREAVRLTAHLNATKDKRIEAVRQYADKHLCQHDAEELRKNPTLRVQVAGHAQSAIDMMDKTALKKH
jgi:hypothetical protein